MSSSSVTTQLLHQHYNLPTNALPEERPKSRWTSHYKFGFLLGIVAHGMDHHIAQLHSLLASGQFARNEQEFIESMFDIYIRPFHRDFDAFADPAFDWRDRGSCVGDGEPDTNDMTYTNFRTVVETRDEVCLYCWDNTHYKIAPIIRQDTVVSLLERVGLHHKHEVQNGLRLCLTCHSQFTTLKRYIDTVDDRLVLKLTIQSRDETSEKHKAWIRHMLDLEFMRCERAKYWKETDRRLGVEADGEMALYFAHNSDSANHPNRQALQLHKTACLIWAMAGGTEPDDVTGERILAVATMRVDDMIWINPIL